MARLTPLAQLTAVTLLAVGLTGCARTQTTPFTLAEGAIRTSVEQVATKLARQAATMESPVALSLSQMGEVTDNVAIDETGSPAPFEPPGIQVGYASSADAASVSLDVLIIGHGQTSENFGSASVSMYGCAELRADFASRGVSIRDVDCPEWLLERVLIADLVSIADISAEAVDDVGW